MDGLMKLSAEVPADGTLPTSGSVHWMMGFDGNNHESGEMPPAGMDGVDPYSTYPAETMAWMNVLQAQVPTVSSIISATRCRACRWLCTRLNFPGRQR